MRLKSIELGGFKSFAKKTQLLFDSNVTAIVGPNGSGKSNIAEAFRFVLGEQSMKSMRGRRGEDLIWNGSHAVTRAGRASVRLILDNADRMLNLDFDEVSFERVVHRDGANDYVLNGSHVRLRDIAELLSQANIGASGHHIISQGEADRILSASAKDRREMIEDALGLTVFLYKREEAERKLGKTAENIKEVEALRRELFPHLKFLEKQVKRIEEGEKLREDLRHSYLVYLKRESVYLKLTATEITAARQGPEREKKQIEQKINQLRTELSKKGEGDRESQELISLEHQGSTAREQRESLTRELGRIEGELEAHKRFIGSSRGGTIPLAEAAQFADQVVHVLEEASRLDLEALRDVVSKIVQQARAFAARISQTTSPVSENSESEIFARKGELEKELHQARKMEEQVSSSVAVLRKKIESQKDASRDAERELFTAMAQRGELEAILASCVSREQDLKRTEALFKTELREAAVLIGREALEYESFLVEEDGEQIMEADMAEEEREKQDERRRKLERLKIRLEEIGMGDAADVLKEHTETKERDEFLGRELSDLVASSERLHQLIVELSETLQSRFGQGIAAISGQFEEFFKLMFGGGSASLQLIKERRLRRVLQNSDEEETDDREEEAEEFEEGIEISVSLPHKRVKGLHMLSGGERALTSIALIFAMSQVNPPPFLILDETDAALDEANSRRYGDMIETLARRSQLILITHNRETMSRAGILYGVTMGSDGVSKLLSVRFEEAAAVAK